jgi:hypothetical protein
MFTPDPIPRPAGPPASSTPLRDYFAQPHPGVTEGYAVLPRSLVESMPLPWQQQMTHLLAEFHQAFGHLNWPIYRVQPSRYEKLADLDEDQLAEVGCIVEIDANGELVYRERNGRRITNAEEATVLVSCLDPIPATQTAPAYATYPHQHSASQHSTHQPPLQPPPTPQHGTPQHSMHQAPQQAPHQAASSPHQAPPMPGPLPQQAPAMPLPPPSVPGQHPGFGPTPGSANGQQW